MKRKEPEDLALVRKGRRSAKTIRGEKLLLASRLNPGAAQDRSKRTVVGADVESLFFTLDGLETANACYKAILDTELELDNYKKGLECVAMHYTKEEVLVNPFRRVLPTRTFNKSARPGVTGPMEDNKWDHKDLEVTDFKRKLTIGAVVQVAVVMDTQLYTFNAKYSNQSFGGPIGLRATCACARMPGRCVEVPDEGLQTGTGGQAYGQHHGLPGLPGAGWRRHNWSLAFCHEWEQEDRSEGGSMSRKTGEPLRRSMNQVFNFLNFTIELEEDFHEGYLPTLDIQVKVLDTGRATYKYF